MKFSGNENDYCYLPTRSDDQLLFKYFLGFTGKLLTNTA